MCSEIESGNRRMESQDRSPRVVANVPRWLEAEVDEGDPDVLVARVSGALRPDSVVFKPMVEELTDVCYDVIENDHGRDENMISRSSRVIELDIHTHCPEWEHCCCKNRGHPTEGFMG